MTLVEHTRRELEIIGEEPDVIEWAVRVAEAYSSYGHSGGSHMVLHPMITGLLNYEPLSPLTNDPDEWTYRDPEMWDGKNPIWQNKRNSKAFSPDAGRTYYFPGDQTDGEEIEYHTSAAMKPRAVE